MSADTIRLTDKDGGPALSVCHAAGPGSSVLYVHGATFPSALSVRYRLDGFSWADDLLARGLDVWSFDLAGFGDSDPPPGLDGASPVGRSAESAAQIARVAHHIETATGHRRFSILAHSWGTLPAAQFAAQHPDRVERLVLFGPVAQRDGGDAPAAHVGSTLSTPESQWASFQAGLPASEPSLIPRAAFEIWAAAYLDTERGSSRRTPPAVRIPAGPQADIAETWAGKFPYSLDGVRAPTLVVYGEWDPITKDADAAWWEARLRNVPGGADVVRLERGAHRMHLEANRRLLFDTVGEWLAS